MSDGPETKSRAERRRHPRHRASFQGEIDGATIGWTRDVSTTGVYLLMPGGWLSEPGASIHVRLRLDEIDPDRPAWVHASGRVVRLEPVGGSVGVAVSIEDWAVGGTANRPAG